MGLLDKLAAGGGVVLLVALARAMYQDAQQAKRDAEETKRRRESPLHFEEGVTHADFVAIVQDVAGRTPRIQEVVTNGMTIALQVRSNSGLSTWDAEIDFNDYGHLTGRWWVSSENSQSKIPKYFAEGVRSQIQEHLKTARTTSPG